VCPRLVPVTPKHEGLLPGRERGNRAFQKRKCAIDPINPRGELACSVFLRAKIENILFNSRPFEAAFSGIGRVLRSLGAGIFFIFFFANYFVHTFLFRQ